MTMTSISIDFAEYTRQLMGPSLFATLQEALAQPAPATIRLNPLKGGDAYAPRLQAKGCAQVPWCREGWTLPERPNFTFDPLMHAGVYYVQEAASMFITEAVRQLVHEPVTALDLCAAPGGKATAMRAALPEGSMLYANEAVRPRASVLLENILKQGHPDVVVTSNSAADYGQSGLQFDLILTDVPCSGEGMFRKEPKAVAQWSPKLVAQCQQLQRNIVADVWPALKDGGLLIYSTCTFNAHEDEENVQWIADTLGADAVELDLRPEWRITGALAGRLPVCRFIPGRTPGEGLFMAVLRKRGRHDGMPQPQRTPRRAAALRPLTMEQKVAAVDCPIVNTDYPTAIKYLQRQAITLPPDAPRGYVQVAYNGHALGYAKNIGTRANNLYPQEWRIKTTHMPDRPWSLSLER